MRDDTRTILGEGRFLRLIRADSWEFAERCRGTGVVGIVAVTDRGELILTEQYRKSVGRAVIDLPAGLVGDAPGEEGEAFEAAASRELLEETGWQARRMQLIARCPTSPGITSEMIELFRATGLSKTHAGGPPFGRCPDGCESIVVHEVPLAGIETWLAGCEARNAAIDVKVYAGLHFARD